MVPERDDCDESCVDPVTNRRAEWRPAGGVVVPMNPLLKAREVAYYLGDSGARLLFAWHGFADEASAGAKRAEAEAVVIDPAPFAEVLASAEPDREVADRQEDDTAVILYTWGTTGQPKGAELTHANLARNTEVGRTDLFRLTAEDVIFGGLPETSPLASFNHPDGQRKPGTIGTPIRGVEMRVVDEQGAELPQGQVGEIAIRGHNVMKGYWRRPEDTAKAIPDGWFRTGDIGQVDEDGYFAIVDRKKDLIIRGGYNVYPREIEEVLYEHPAVGEAAVIGLPHPELGEEVGAAVVLNPGASVTAEELRGHVKTQVAAYKYPRRVWIAVTAEILTRLSDRSSIRERS
jgi:acyl-CoA synthetase (AMP-forming)/AMP-acid ligase II